MSCALLGPDGRPLRDTPCLARCARCGEPSGPAAAGRVCRPSPVRQVDPRTGAVSWTHFYCEID